MSLATVLHQQLLLHVAELRGKDVSLLQLELGPRLLLTLLLDFLLGQFLVSPLVTMCWRSVWLLADWIFDRLLPGERILGFIISLTLGTALTIISRFIIFVPSTLLSSISSLTHLSLTRLFSVLYFCCYMMVWRGWWNLMDLLSSCSTLLLVLALSVQALTRCLPSNVGPPLSFSHDTKRHYLQLPVYTRHTSPLLNIIITSILEITVIQCWFSTWTLLDTAMEQLNTSIMNNIILSLSLGLVSGVLGLTLQLPLLYYVNSDRQSLNNRTFFCQHFAANFSHDLLSVLGLAATVSSLRGYWTFLDLVFQDSFWLSVSIPGIIGFVSLLSLKVMSSLHGGVVMARRQRVVFPCWLLSYWLVKETVKDCDLSLHDNLLLDCS